MSRLENWSLICKMDNPFQAPELYPVLAQGQVYGDIRFFEGTFITTSMVKSFDKENRILITQNTTYELGEPSPSHKQYLIDNNIEF